MVDGGAESKCSCEEGGTGGRESGRENLSKTKSFWRSAAPDLRLNTRHKCRAHIAHDHRDGVKSDKESVHRPVKS